MKERYIATFYSHFGAVRFIRELKKSGIMGTLMPVPRNLSSSCGTCVAYETEDLQLDDVHGEIEQVVKVVSEGYELVYRAQDS